MHRSLCLHNSPMHGGSVALRTSGERWHWPMQTLPPCCQGLTVYSALTCVPPCQNDLSVHWHLACHHGCEGHSPLLCSQEVLRKPHSAGEVGHLGVPLGHLGRMRPMRVSKSRLATSAWCARLNRTPSSVKMPMTHSLPRTAR